MRLKINPKIVHLLDLFLDYELDSQASDQPVLLEPFLEVLIVLKYFVVHNDLLVLSMLLHQFSMLLLNNFVDVLKRTLLFLVLSGLRRLSTLGFRHLLQVVGRARAVVFAPLRLVRVFGDVF